MNAAASAAARKTKKLMKFGLSLFRRNFNSSKCKTAAKMAVARIKLLKNKREVVVRQMRRDIALLLQSKQDSTARIRVEHVIREQNVLTANEFVELFCELIVSRLSIIAKQRECPADLKEGIASVIFAAPRCSEIPELLALKDIFEKKYGRDFVSAATDLRPNAGVNRMLIEKLSVRTPTGQVKLKVMKEIAKEYQIDWDTTESEAELLKPPEERIDGPQTFVSATSLPVKHDPVQPVQEPIKPSTRSTNDRDIRDSHFENTASAAEAAAEAAKKAIAAAQAAAYLANRDSSLSTPPSQFDESSKPSNANNNHQSRPQERMFGSESYNSLNDEIKGAYKRHSYNAASDIKFESESYNDSNDNNTPFRIEGEERGIYRRHSYNADSDIKFDESDCDEEIEADNYHPPGRFSLPPRRPPPTVPSTAPVKQESFHRVHPKLPDYEDLAARFEALKYRKS